jgi:alkanesulfonate monooxygenase SsuD/methylene tetrahydromethanopterin reductase-like flavin-dependent oxidoreductase (luciferase family)
VREGRETTRAYVDLFSSFTSVEALRQWREGDPRKEFFELAKSMPEHLEERAVAGTPAECRRRLRELRDEFGIDHIAFYFHAGGRAPERARYGIELFANEVMPDFKSS